MDNEPSWDLLRTFAAVMQEGSLSGAARSLGIAQPSVSRHIDELERSLAAKLFVRSQRGLSPTDRALAIAPYAEALSATATALLRAASAPPDAVAGTVRVTASQAVAVGHLPPILAALRREHPRLSIELVPSDALDDLLARRADIAVRMVDPVQQALVARRVGSVTLGLYASQEYLARRGVPGSLEDLAGHDLIGPDTPTPFVRAVLAKLPTADLTSFALRSDSDVVHLAAIRAGVGIGVAQVELARRDLALVRVLPDGFAHELPLWVAMHEDLRTSPRCRIVFDALADGLATSTA
jgi:DNA-binding transcriptional LysR family regulator